MGNYGDTVLPFSRAMANQLARGVTREPSAETRESAVFFDILGTFLVSYPESLARPLHFTGAAAAAAWALLEWCPGRTADVARLAGWLCLSFVASLVFAMLCGAMLAFSPRALIGHGHPELTPLLFGAPAILGFSLHLHRHWPVKKDGQQEAEVAAAASVVVAAGACVALSLHKDLIMIAYIMFAWSVSPALADMTSRAFPCRLRPTIAVFGHVLPWVLLVQLGFVMLEIFIPLTGRSGTSVPGDVVQAGSFGLLLGLLMALSSRFLVVLPKKGLHRTLRLAFLLGVLMAIGLFPYSGERLKRSFMQHTKRVSMEWNVTSKGLKKIGKAVDSSGIWTVAMDWNGVSTLRDHAPFGLPADSTPIDDWDGLYGNLPHYFPLRPFLAGGTWAPRPAPALPTPLKLKVKREGKTGGAGNQEQLLHISVSGGSQIMLALGPRKAVQKWSLGYLPGGFDAKGAVQRWQHNGSNAEGKFGHDWHLPPARNDCDCFWLFFTEGGKNPAKGQHEAFNFAVVALPGELHLDIWAAHLKTASPEMKEHLSRAPGWMELNAWATELQLHTIHV